MKKESFYLENGGQECLPVTLIAAVSANCMGNQSDNIQELLTDRLVAQEYSLFRGIRGRGFLCFAEETAALQENQIYIMPTRELVTVVPNAAQWDFIQFRFLCDGLEAMFQPHRTYRLRYKKEEELYLNDLFHYQFAGTKAARGYISALFAAQLHKWHMALEHAGKADSMNLQKIEYAIEYINLHLDAPIQVSELSRRFHISERHFRTLFYQVAGASPKAYQQKLRMEQCAAMLQSTGYSVREISSMLGYSSPYQLSRDFKKYYGLAPSEYRKG
ncbi:MAG: AraC family transcriptional regulator [Clostridiales bacterium]|nr:AraC family transcriptional regulator [Clostridiales bacterium]